MPNGTTAEPNIDFRNYDDSAILDLLRQILEAINNQSLTFEYNPAVDVPTVDVAYEGALSEFIYSSPTFTTVFPFSLPWDFVRGVKLLGVSPVAPQFEIPFNIPAFGLFPGYSGSIVLDFSKYDKYFHVVRWFSTVLFVMSLVFISTKIVRSSK